MNLFQQKDNFIQNQMLPRGDNPNAWTETKDICIAHSPDADDYFMFWALRNRLIDTAGEKFSFIEMDTAKLNKAAKTKEYDVSAVSVAAYPGVAEDYLILPHGASVGRNYGPIVVATNNVLITDLNRLRVGIPGENTTAGSLLKILAPEAETTEISLTPYQSVFEALKSGSIEAAVLIHEGQLSYSSYNLFKIIDLGQWWYNETALPLPLGINVIKKDLGQERITKISALLKNSISYGLEHRDLFISEFAQVNQARGVDEIARRQLAQYLDMYANEDTLSLSTEAKAAIETLLYRLAKANGNNSQIRIEYAP